MFFFLRERCKGTDLWGGGKAALSVLIRNYVFELPGGPGTEIVRHKLILARAKVQGENRARLPLSVRRFGGLGGTWVGNM